MSKSKKRINPGTPKTDEKKPGMITTEIKKITPILDFRYLHHSNKCWVHVRKTMKDAQEFKRFCDEFQSFVYSFSIRESMFVALKAYQSHVSSTKKMPENFDLSQFPEETKELINDETRHLHMKVNGKGVGLVWGFLKDGIFYITALDPNHELT